MARFPARNALAVATMLFAATACGDAEHERDITPMGRSASAIFGSSAPSTAMEDFVVRLIPGCSGVLVAPTIVLTARHCVTSDLIEIGEFTCTLGTEPTPPQQLKVFIGSEVTTGRLVPVKRILIDFDSTNCRDDVAAVELAEPVMNVATPALLLDALPDVGSQGTIIGWGATDDSGATQHVSRLKGTGAIVGVGAGTFATQGSSRFLDDGYVVMSGVSVCRGDSGGAMLDAKGALIGTIFGNLQAQATTKRSCADAVSLAIPHSKHVAFIERVFQSTGKMPVRAGKPPPADLGGPCTQNNECNSNYCVGVGARSICSKLCSPTVDCGGGLVCTSTGKGQSVCLDVTSPPGNESACAASAGHRGWQGWPSVLAAALALFAWRRRRSAHGERSSR